MNQPTSQALAAVYGEMGLSSEEFYALTERSLTPRSSGMLADKLAGLGIGTQHHLLDVGCRDANHTIALAQRFGCTALGIDPVALRISNAQSAIAEAGLSERVQAVVGWIEAIPAEDASVDFVWCRDMLNHVAELGVGLAECYRVLRPGGRMLVYQTFSTELLEPNEAAFIYDTMGIVPQNQSDAFFENTARAVGFAITEKDAISSEWREFWEEDGSRKTANQLLRIARMRRNRDELIPLLTETHYNIEIADCLWGVYQMIGKLCPTVYVLGK
ncbi:MAG: class I SAM-dependent methyltransferase [Caldilineaceae bacterium]